MPIRWEMSPSSTDPAASSAALPPATMGISSRRVWRSATCRPTSPSRAPLWTSRSSASASRPVSSPSPPTTPTIMTYALDLEALIASRRAGYMLPAPFYLSQEVFERDVELIFGRHWIYVGVAAEIAEPGDFFTAEIGSDSILIVRDDDMDIRAFHNVCRHRGARLRAPGSGIVGNLVCPYHQWTYNLRGELIHNQHMGEGFERCKYSLKSVQLQSVAGLLFICLAPEAPPDR